MSVKGRTVLDSRINNPDGLPYYNLLAAMFIQAIRDATGKDYDKAVDAVYWLYQFGPDWVLYFGLHPEKYFQYVDRTLAGG